MEPDTRGDRMVGPRLKERRPLEGECVKISSLLEATLECPICEELFEDAVICACCKSTFCGSCLPNGTHRAATLVAAEEGQPPRLLRDETMRRAVACLPRYCRFAFVAETATNSWKRVEDGCSYVGTESDAKTHEEACEFRPVRCLHCQVEMAERDRKGHQAVCRQNCSFCGENILAQDFQAHYVQVCPNARVACPKPGCTFFARPGDMATMSRHAQLCRPPPIEQLSAQGAPPDLEAETREERPAPAIEPFTTPERTRPLSGPIKEMAPEGVPEIQAGHSTADGPGKTRGKDGFGPAVPRDVPVIGVTENAFTPEMTLEAPNSPRQTPSSGEKSSGGSAGSGNTVLNGQNSAGLRALLRACMLVDLNDAQLKSEAGTDGLGRRTRAEKGPLEEEKAPGEGETVPGRGQTGPGKEETIPGKGDVFPSEGEEGPGKEKELVLSTSTDFPPKLLGVKDLSTKALNLLLHGYESWPAADTLVRQHTLAPYGLEHLLRMKVEEEGPGALRPALLKAGRLTGEEGSLEAFLLSLGRLRCDVLRVMVFILRGEVGNDIHSRHLKKEELWTEVLEEFGLAQYELLEELRSIESRARPGKAAKGKSKERVRAQDDSGAEEVVSLSLNQRQKTNAVRKVLLGVVEDLKGEDCASAFLHPAEEEEEGYNAVIERPISLRDIQDKIREQSDYTLQDLEADVKLIVQNAREYCHARYPSIVGDADRLYELFQTKLDEAGEEVIRLDVKDEIARARE